MAVIYFVDTSALGKRYIIEVGSPWLRETLDPTTGCQVIIVRTTTVEMIAAISRRERGGTLTFAHAGIARMDFRADLANEYQVVEMSVALANQAMQLAERRGLRGYDAIQLAAALQVDALRTAQGLSADTELNTAAAARLCGK